MLTIMEVHIFKHGMGAWGWEGVRGGGGGGGGGGMGTC